MLPRLKIRFQHWVVGSIALLVLILAGIFLVTVLRTFTKISQEDAITRFDLIADQASSQLDALVRQNGKFVTAQVRSELSQFVRDSRLNPQSLVATFLGSLESDPSLYSHFFGLGNEEFLQVIGIRGDERIIAALKAPPGAYFAIRRITRAADGVRTDHYQFLDRNRGIMSSRDQAATLVPSSRPWYGEALTERGLIVTEPYLFASTGELGITVAAPLPGRAGVLATDISLRSLGSLLTQLSLPPHGAILVQDGSGRLLAFHGRGPRFGSLKPAMLIQPDKIDDPYLAPLGRDLDGRKSRIMTLGGEAAERFVVTQHRTQAFGGHFFRIVVLAPVSDFTGSFRQAERDVLLVSMVVLTLLIPLAFLGSRRVAQSLSAMARDSERLKVLDFSGKPHLTDTFIYEINALGDAQMVMHTAIQHRTRELRKSQEKLARLVDNGILLAREQNRTLLLRHTLFAAREIAQCAAATLFLKTEHDTLGFALRTSEDTLPSSEIPLYDDVGAPNDKFVVVHAVLRNESVVIDDVYSEGRFDMSGTKHFSEESGLRTVSMLVVPLSPRAGEVIGAIQLLNALDPDTGAIIPFHKEMVGFTEALAAQSAVALENLSLIEAQKAMMDSLIKLIASAIDAKSHYTGGHCERVPELGIMLAEAAGEVTQGPLADFRFNTEDEWREFRIGAWLHDCGKVTTPEYVVDKASKLETIYNRIHEVRTRFEVLLRDARIEQLEAVAGGADPEAAQTRYDTRRAQLMDDFEFLADCNLGSESMAPEKLERLKKIANETWQRHFNDRLGLAEAELKHYQGEPEPLPVTEKLLADKPQHVIERVDRTTTDPKWGFKVNVPDRLYNYGELYNLSIVSGTLTEEERFKINEHVMQSLIMLEQLPLPKNLRRVPAYAGSHHETMIGTGYPRQLTEADLSVPMRIMAIADIFEALTASDRPYKKTKKLSEAIRILSFFKKDRHIDPVLFDLFLSSGVYKRYAEKYLLPEQMDEVDINRYLG